MEEDFVDNIDIYKNDRSLNLLDDSLLHQKFLPKFDLEVNMHHFHHSGSELKLLQMNLSDPLDDFAVTFIESDSAEMVHRFIRIKDIEDDRKVLMENAIERYLVSLDETLTDVLMGTEKE